MTKPQLAVDMLYEQQEQKLLSYKYVLADSLYGNSPEFIDAIEEHDDLIYFVSMPSDTLCWLEKPITLKKDYKHKGKVHKKDIIEKGEKSPISFETLAKNLNNYFWYRRKVSEGTKGSIDYEFTKRRVVLSKKGLPQKTVWLIIKRTLGSDPTYSYYISNTPENTKLETFVWLSGLRWAIEQCFEETKSEFGMDQYEVRKYPGWNHPSVLQRWKREFAEDAENAFPGKGCLKESDEEVRRLSRENKHLKEERDILKKALAIFSKHPE